LHDFHLHQSHDHSHHADEGKTHTHDSAPETRFKFATGARYTRLSLENAAAHLWESTVGAEYMIAPWLHFGGEIAYGWFDSIEGGADGFMVPHLHIDTHLPLGGSWELLAGFDVGFPGGKEVLVGRLWEFTPSVELRYERERWFAAAGGSFVFVEGEDAHDDGDEEVEFGDGEDGHSDHDGAPDFHEIVDPHGERELYYHAAFGVRAFDERVELESRLSGIHIVSGETPDRNYIRGGLRASWKLDERWVVRAEASMPLTNARRNEWQASLAVRVGF
jgi:hypothetical protein